MAKHEQDREDILREATALVRRIEVLLPDMEEPCVIGFRRSGAASFFFGVDPVYQFNNAGELRRAFVGGQLVKAERGQLVRLERRRTHTEVQLLRRELAEDDQEMLLKTMRTQLDWLREQMSARVASITRQVPEDVDVVSEVRRWLDSMPDELLVASRAHVDRPS